jgi:hypothetical protein
VPVKTGGQRRHGVNHLKRDRHARTFATSCGWHLIARGRRRGGGCGRRLLARGRSRDEVAEGSATEAAQVQLARGRRTSRLAWNQWLLTGTLQTNWFGLGRPRRLKPRDGALGLRRLRRRRHELD